MVCFRAIWFYFEKSFCILVKVVVIEQKWLYWGKVVVFGQKWLLSDKNCCIRVKVVVLWQGGCIRAE